MQRASITVEPSGQRHYQLTGRYRPTPRVRRERRENVSWILLF